MRILPVAGREGGLEWKEKIFWDCTDIPWPMC